MSKDEQFFQSQMPDKVGEGHIDDLPTSKTQKKTAPKKTVKKKNPGGRPTKYSDELCEKIVSYFKCGMSIAEICLELDICKQTFYTWCENHKKFLDSKKKGEFFSEGWWMKQARINLKDKDFNATLFYMNMKNRFGWSDKQEVKMNASVTNKDIQKATMEAIKAKHKKDS